MPIQVTKRWSDYRIGAKAAAMSFDVSGVENGTAARLACPFALNSQHPENQVFKVDDWSVSEPGWRLYRVTFSFSEPDNGSEHPEPTDPGGLNLLALPATYQWQLGNTTEPVDRDKDKNPICASDGDPFDPPISKQVATVFLTVTRYEAAPFDVVKALAYMNTVNAAGMTIEGHAIDKGQMLCHSITPTETYTSKTKIVQVAYNFELRMDGFKARVLDQGFRGWLNPGGGFGGGADSTEIFDSKGTQITSPVRLNGKGKPMEPSFTGKGRGTLVDNAGLTAGTAVATPDGKAYYLEFSMYPEKDHASLGL